MEQVKLLYERLETARSDKERIDILNNLAMEFLNSDLAEAERLTQQALEIARANNDQQRIADSYNNFGRQAFRRHDYEKALEHFRAAAAIFETIGHNIGLGNTLDHISMCYMSLGQVNEALSYALRSLELMGEDEDDSRGIRGMCLNNIGNIYERMRDYEKAMYYYEKGLKVFETNGRMKGQINLRGNIALILTQWKRYEEALEHFQFCLKEAGLLRHRQVEALTLVNIGNCYFGMANYSEAMKWYQQAMKLYKHTVDNKRGQADAHRGLGNVYVQFRGFTNAIDQFEKALVLLKQASHPPGECLVKIDLGCALIGLGEGAKAAEILHQALVVAQKNNFIQEMQEAHQYLSEAYKLLGDQVQARQHEKLSQGFYQELRSRSRKEKFSSR